MKKYLPFVLFFITSIVYGQKAASEKFKILVEPYTFNLPVQKISLPIPAYMGFMAPVANDERTKIEVGEDVNYFILDQDLQVEKKFEFSKNSNEKEALVLSITPLPSFFANTYLEQQKAKYSFFERIDPIKNGLGKATAYRCQVGDQSRDFYVFYLDKNLYSFSFPARSSDKTRYLNIIKKAKNIASREAISRYNDYLKSIYNNDIPATPSSEIIEKNEHGAYVIKTDPDQTFDFTTEGLSYTLPAGFTVVTSANSMSKDGNNIDIVRNEDFLKPNNSEYYSTTLNNNQNVGFRYYSTFKNKGCTSNSYVINLQSYKNGEVNSNYKIGKAQDIVIDGIESKAVFYGDDYYGFICINIESKNAYNTFFLGGVTKETLPLYDKIISQIKIETNAARSKLIDNSKPLSSFISLKDKPKYKFKYSSSCPKVSDVPHNFEVTFDKIGLTVFLPGYSRDYKYNTSICYCDYETLKIENGCVYIAPSLYNPTISVQSENDDYSVSLVLEKEFNSSYSVKDLLERDLLVSYTKKKQSKFNEVYIWTSLDNVQWGVCIDYAANKARVIGKNGEYSIYYEVECKNNVKLKSLLSLFRKFKLSKI